MSCIGNALPHIAYAYNITQNTLLAEISNWITFFGCLYVATTDYNRTVSHV